MSLMILSTDLHKAAARSQEDKQRKRMERVSAALNGLEEVHVWPSAQTHSGQKAKPNVIGWVREKSDVGEM